eukprot:CAMPEP_0182444870 /NCGR_PEP_ID=MMETSP1172-20130603/3181_1 /TAXON_ID=708627 /ORGANISM="Timspurckia oligopyrenoides, Strain CCMP3278" /LENGTH=237 /DNA_ID=CAMNT_0024640521 /DNA_START=68 /DNA_END=781 /DNA_ORIENTATION=-
MAEGGVVVVSPGSVVGPEVSVKHETSSCVSRRKELKESVTVFDWDDTLFPTSCLHALGVDMRGPAQIGGALAQQLFVLQKLVVSVLERALKYGRVIIITNGEEGWVQFSGARFMPEVFYFMRFHNIRVVSARSTYEHENPSDPSHWKIRAFSEEFEKLIRHGGELNLLSIGDGESELNASYHVRSEFLGSCVKTIKFLECPTIEQLARQIHVVEFSFSELYEHDSNADLDLATLTYN